MPISISSSSSSELSSEPLTCLVVDDKPVNRLLLADLLEEDGHRILEAQNGAVAVEIFERERPDIVFLDIRMPVMDGYETASRIKAASGDDFVPVIFVTAVTNESDLARCLEAGGDDFLTKPFNAVILEAKVNAALRNRVQTQTIRQQRDRLIAHRERLRQEYRLAERVFQRIVRPGCPDGACPNLRYLLQPTQIFNGDFLLASPAPGGRMHLLLGDFTGHGLSAAIGTMPVSRLFYELSRRGAPFATLVRQINRLVHDTVPVGMFLAAAVIEYDSVYQNLHVWNGGQPDLVLVSNDSTTDTFPSVNLAMGILPDLDDVVCAGVTCRVEEGALLYAVSDGVIEARNARGESFGQKRLRTVLRESAAQGEDGFDRLIRAVSDHVGEANHDDDVTLLQLRCQPQPVPSVAPEVPEYRDGCLGWPEADGLYWYWQVSFGAMFLRRSDPVPVVLDALAGLPGLDQHHQRLHILISELFNNAIDHGLLNLDSGLKGSPEGFEEYYRRRERKLESLQKGSIQLEIACRFSGPVGQLSVTVEDSGPGYYHDGTGQPVGPDGRPIGCNLSNDSYCGRGLQLIRSLCRDVQISERGNRVQALYEWQADLSQGRAQG
ncbi:MAG: SpoIIE family protein phosphatase [Halothiobacillaceae bacterium]